MHTDPHDVDTDHAIRRLEQLVQLEYDAMAAYRAAIDRVQSTAARGELGMFFEDHDETARALATCIERYGGTAHHGDLERAWAKGGEVIGKASGDSALLGALANLESDVHRAYQDAQEDLRVLADPPLASAIATAIAEDEQHREWLAHAIDRPPMGT